MALNFNVDPYFDDFDPTKSFHRILYKPGVAVQARELTQSQSILQDQISKFGLGIYSDGSMITGGNITVDTNIVTCKLTSDSLSILELDNVVGLFVVGSDSKFAAEIISVNKQDFYINTKPLNNVLQFISGETINFFNTKLEALSFTNNESITPLYTTPAVTQSSSIRSATGDYLSNELTILTSSISIGDKISYTHANTVFQAVVVSIIDNNHLTVNQTLPFDFNSASVTVLSSTSAQSMEVNVDSGVWFTNGYFVYSGTKSIIPQSSTIYPSCVVGFEVDETTVDSYDDSTLLDPAIGASNYQAPGADRYQINLNLVSKPYVNSQVVEDLTTNKFIELIRIDSGVITNIKNVPSFSSIGDAMARNVYDQSGNFIVDKFNLKIPTGRLDETNANTLAEISAGKAYINGYAVETIAPTKYILETPRDTASKTYQDITTYYGNYIRGRNIKGSIPNFQINPSVELHNVAFGAVSTTSLIGNAKLINFSYDSNSGSNSVYKIFLTDVVMISNATVNIASIVIPGSGNNYSTSTFSANTTETTITDPNYDTLLFELPQKYIANVSNIDYVTTRYYTTGTFTNGVYTINTNGVNEIFVGSNGAGGTVIPSVAQLNYMIVTTSASGSYPAGKYIPLDGTQANVSMTINNTGGLPQATFNIAGGFNGTATVYATISVANDTLKNKVVHTNQYSLVSANTLFSSIDIGYSDILNFKGIYTIGNTNPFLGNWSSSTTYSANNNVLYDDGIVYISNINSNHANTPNTSSSWSAVDNIKNYFVVDCGQRDTHYDHGYIVNINEAVGNVVVVFDYFTHTSGTGVITVDSYPIDYSWIPSYTSPITGKTYNLRDTLDFRPRRQDGLSAYQSHQIPSPLNNTFADYSYYMGRVDKVVLHTNGQFKTVKGISAYSKPVPPPDVNNTLTLFTITYPPYTYNTSQIVVNPTNLKRYTMADIGLLDQRITTLEKYTSLSLLETHTSGMNITDSSGNNLLFKNGYLVDGFTSPDVADVTNPNTLMSIDPIQQICRPYYDIESVSFDLDNTQGNFVASGKTNNMLTVNHDVVTFSYDEVPLVFQNVASEIVNVNPFNVLNFVGSITLTPSSDVWHSQNTVPQINVVNNDQYAWISAVTNIGLNSQWNQWQMNWAGQSTDTLIPSGDTTQVTRDTTAITSAINSQGLQNALNGGLITVTSNQNILSSSSIPYARSIPVDFVATGLTPYTQVFPFIGNVPVDQYTNPKTFNGGVYYVDIKNGGSGYASGNAVAMTVTGNCTTPAILTANVVSGVVANVTIISTGSGYATPPIISLNSSNTSAAVFSANTFAVSGAPLVTDINGKLEGTIIIPNDDAIQIPTGSMNFILTDNPLNPPLAKSYASETFYSQGTLDTVQTTVVSVRPPQASLIPPPPAPVYNPPVITGGGGGSGIDITKPTPPTTQDITVNTYDWVTTTNSLAPKKTILGPEVKISGINGHLSTYTVVSERYSNDGQSIVRSSATYGLADNGVVVNLGSTPAKVVGAATTSTWTQTGTTTVTVPVGADVRELDDGTTQLWL